MRRTRWADVSDRRLVLYAVLFGLPYAVVPAVMEVPASETTADMFWNTLPWLVLGVLAAIVFGLLGRTLRRIERRERKRR